MLARCGATGNRNDDCLWGGRMMDADQMEEMRGDLDDARAELDDYGGRCWSDFDPDVCPGETAGHGDRMGGMLDRMLAHANPWWPGDRDGDNHNHWGDGGGRSNHRHSGGTDR